MSMLCFLTESFLNQLHVSFETQGRCSVCNEVILCMLLSASYVFLKNFKLGHHLPCCNIFLGEIQKCGGSDPYLQQFNVIPLKSKEQFSFLTVKVLLQKVFLTASILTERERKKSMVIWGEYLASLL